MSAQLHTRYLMEHESEGRRIRDKTDPERTREQLLMTGLRSGMHALDVGCASGVATLEMARISQPSKAVGVDMSRERLSEAQTLVLNGNVSNIEFTRGNAYELPFENDTFDFVWSRFLLEYLKDPMLAIREMRRVTRPGGLVVSADLDGNCMFHYPIDSQLEACLHKVMSMLASTGFDPWIGRKLYHYYRQIGFSQISAHMVPHHLIAGEPSERDRENWHEKIDRISENLHDFFPEEELTSLTTAFKQLIDSAETFTYSPLIMVVGVKEG